MVEIVKFPKKCPHCKVPLRFVQKMWCSWESCDNDKCSYLETQELTATKFHGIEIQDAPVPYKCNFVNRGRQPTMTVKGEF